MKQLDWIFLALLVAAFLVYDICVVWLLDFTIGREYLAFTWIGICIGQINLIGAWGALAPGKVIVRLPWAAFLGVLMWQAIAVGQSYETGYAANERLMTGISIGFGVVVTQIPLFLARRPFRWRLLPPRFPLDDLAQTDAQFNLKHLFLGMFLASLALAMARFSLSGVQWRNFGMDSELYVLLGVAGIVNAMVTAPCIWMSFCTPRRLAMWVVPWTVYVTAVSAGELLILTSILGAPGGGGNFILVFSCLNLTQCLTVFATMLVLRGLGFKLIRAPDSRAETGKPKPAPPRTSDSPAELAG